MKAAPIKLCKAVDMETVGSLSAAEKGKLAAMVGNAQSQQMKAFSNIIGGEQTITEKQCSPQTTLAFSACCDATFILEAYCAKVFIQNCENCSFIFKVEGKILTETIEMHRCVDSKLEIFTRVGTLQVDQCVNCSCTIDKVDNFGNPSMMRKGREFGKDGRVIWAGCENLKVKVASDEVVGDFDAEAKVDLTANIERTQYKVSYDGLNVLRSEKVTRLANGFPTTKREDDEHVRREEAALQGMADKMGITIKPKEDKAVKQEPNAPCACGSGKKYKKCCWN